MIEIPITKGYTALVSDEDADLADLKWWACFGKVTKQFPYAARDTSHEGKRKTLYLHRVVLERKLNRPLQKDEVCDHIDNNPLNNCRDNLRACSVQQNNLNVKAKCNSTTGYIGVSWSKNARKYEAYIAVNRRRKHLGLFTDIVEAAQARDRKAVELYGEFAALNFPIETYRQECSS